MKLIRGNNLATKCVNCGKPIDPNFVPYCSDKACRYKWTGVIK